MTEPTEGEADRGLTAKPFPKLALLSEMQVEAQKLITARTRAMTYSSLR